MGLTTADEIVEAVEHLPRGATLIVDQVGWDEYECLLASLAERPGLRVTYDSGVLEIMTVSPRHGRYQGFMGRLVQSSNCLPGLTPQLIAETIELSRTVGQDEACKVFRRKIQDLVQAK